MLPPPPRVFLPPASWIILSTSPPVPVCQRGVQRDIRPWLASPSSPTVRCLASPPPCSELRPTDSPQVPAMLAANRVAGCRRYRWIYVLAVVYLIITLFIPALLPPPLPPSQLTQRYQPAAAPVSRELGGGEHQGNIRTGLVFATLTLPPAVKVTGSHSMTWTCVPVHVYNPVINHYW